MDTKLKQGILISLLSFITGGVMTYFVSDYLSLKARSSFQSSKPKSIITRDKIISKNKDHFNKMNKVHAQMSKRMDQFFGSSFGNSFFDVDPFSGSSFTKNTVKINRYEDDAYKYIELSGDGINKESLQVDISNGIISINGEIKHFEENNNEGAHSKSSYISKFNQSFNVPDGVDEASVKIEPEQGKLVILFPKERI